MGPLKIFFSRTTEPILTRLGINHPWRERIQVPLKEGDKPSPRGDNSERVKIHRTFLKIFFSRTRKPKSIKLYRNYPLVKRIQVCSNKVPGPLQRGNDHRNVKKRVRSFKNLVLKNYEARKAKFYMKAF
jgi:hypothetical protein